MPQEYDRRQVAGKWPERERWSPDRLPGWYMELLIGLAGNLTAWRRHDPGQRLDPRCDPRCPRHRARHAANGRDPWTERRKAEVLAELWAADRAMRATRQPVNRLRLAEHRDRRHQAGREGRHANG